MRIRKEAGDSVREIARSDNVSPATILRLQPVSLLYGIGDRNLGFARTYYIQSATRDRNNYNMSYIQRLTSRFTNFDIYLARPIIEDLHCYRRAIPHYCEICTLVGGKGHD